MLAELTLIKEVKKTDIIMIRNKKSSTVAVKSKFGQKRNSYSMNIDRERNCYNYKGFDHITRYCRSQKIVGYKNRMAILQTNF